MADKTTGGLPAVQEAAIGSLPGIADLYDDTLLPVEQGRNSAGSVKIQSSRQHLMGGLLLRAPSKPAQPQRGLTQLAFQPHRQLKGALLRMNPHAPVKAPLISPAGTGIDPPYYAATGAVNKKAQKRRRRLKRQRLRSFCLGTL